MPVHETIIGATIRGGGLTLDLVKIAIQIGNLLVVVFGLFEYINKVNRALLALRCSYNVLIRVRLVSQLSTRRIMGAEVKRRRSGGPTGLKMKFS